MLDDEKPPSAVSSRLTVRSRRSLGAAAITAPVNPPRKGENHQAPGLPRAPDGAAT